MVSDHVIDIGGKLQFSQALCTVEVLLLDLGLWWPAVTFATLGVLAIQIFELLTQLKQIDSMHSI